MKKTFYYNFIPTKAEEEAANETPFQVTRVLVEIRDIYSPPKLDPRNPWQLRKRLTQSEMMTGKLVVPFTDAFQHVFRYWNLCVANQVVVLGQKIHVIVWDVTDDNNPKRHCNEATFFDKLLNPNPNPNDEDYVLSCPNLVHDRRLRAEDEIGLYWDLKSGTFQFKLLRRAI